VSPDPPRSYLGPYPYRGGLRPHTSAKLSKPTLMNPAYTQIWMCPLIATKLVQTTVLCYRISGADNSYSTIQVRTEWPSHRLRLKSSVSSRNGLPTPAVLTVVKRLLVLGWLVVSACGPAIKAGPAASPSVAPTSATATASASSPSGTLTCRLPLARPVPPADNSHRWTVGGALVNFPAGDLSIDPNGAFLDTPDVGLKSVTQPYLSGGDT
jgi:hypothetical protein